MRLHLLIPQRLLACLLLLAVMAQTWVPAGFMPDVHGQGGGLITICSATGTQTVWVDDEGKPAAPEHGKAEAASHCLFGSALLGMALAQPPALPQPLAFPQARVTPWHTPQLSLLLAYAGNPRSPPVSA